jgi:hypothetical protein
MDIHSRQARWARHLTLQFSFIDWIRRGDARFVRAPAADSFGEYRTRHQDAAALLAMLDRLGLIQERLRQWCIAEWAAKRLRRALEYLNSLDRGSLDEMEGSAIRAKIVAAAVE